MFGRIRGGSRLDGCRRSRLRLSPGSSASSSGSVVVVRIGWLKGPGWRAWLPAIAFVCERHGVVVDYEHGYEGVLVCPLCQSEEASLDAGKSGGLGR